MKKLFIAVIGIALLSLSACKEEAGEGILNMKYATIINDENLELNKVYDLDGDSVYFTLINYYISDVEIMDKDGNSAIEVKDVTLIDLSDPTTFEFNYTLESDAYKNPSFTVGLTDDRNATDPSSYASDHPMSLNRSMYWLMSQAYIYFKVEGFRINNGVDEPLVYHVGMNGFAQTKLKEQAFSINKDNTTTIATTLDMNDLFVNIDFDTEPETHTMNNMPLAMKMMNNFVNALSVD